QTDEWRHTPIGRALQLRHRGAQLWPAAAWVWLPGMVPVIDLDCVVVGLVADQRADHHELVHDSGEPGQGLADLRPDDVGCGRLPWTGDFFWSAGLQIKHVLVRRTTNQIDEDNRLVGRPDPCDRLSPQKAGEGEAAKPEGSDPEETPAGQAMRDGGRLSSQAVAGRHRYLGR